MNLGSKQDTAKRGLRKGPDCRLAVSSSSEALASVQQGSVECANSKFFCYSAMISVNVGQTLHDYKL